MTENVNAGDVAEERLASPAQVAWTAPALTTPELLPSLAAAGPFAVQIESAHKKAQENRGRLVKDTPQAEWYFERLREEYEKAKIQQGTAEDSREAFLRDIAKRACYYPSGMHNTSNPVIAYCVAHAEGLRVLCDEWHESAQESYVSCRDFYDWLLGHLIPDAFRQEGRWIEVSRAYDRHQNATALNDWEVFEARIVAKAGQPLRGLTTGLPSLDHALQGMRGLAVLGGPTGVGKSALATNIILAALRGHPDVAALYLLLDPGMTRETVYERLLCMAAGVESRTLYGPAGDARDARGKGRELLKSAVLPRLKVAEISTSREREVDADLISEHCNALQQATQARRVLVVIDYLSYIDVPKKVSPVSLEADVARINAILEARCDSRTGDNPDGDPYLVIAEINKNWRPGDPLTGGDLLGSTRLQYSPDVILMLEPAPSSTDQAAACVPVTLRVVKGRDGVTRSTIPLLFEHAKSHFREQAAVLSSGAGPKNSGRRGAATRGGLDPLVGIDEA